MTGSAKQSIVTKQRKNGLLRCARNEVVAFRFNFQTADTRPHSRGTILPEVCISLSLKHEGAGNAGCALHPRSRVQIMCKKGAHEHRGQRRQSDIPCAMALRLISRSSRSVG